MEPSWGPFQDGQFSWLAVGIREKALCLHAHIGTKLCLPVHRKLEGWGPPGMKAPLGRGRREGRVGKRQGEGEEIKDTLPLVNSDTT